MANADHPLPHRSRPLAIITWVVFLAYVFGALFYPSRFPALPLTGFLIVLLFSAIAFCIISRGATRVYCAAFAAFGLAQCVVLGLLTGLGMRTFGFFHLQSLQEVYLRIHRKPLGGEFYVFANAINVLVTIVIASVAANVCRMLYLSSESVDSRKAADEGSRP